MITAPDASFSAPIEELQTFSVDDLVAEIKAKLLSRAAGIKGIGRIFRAMDDNGNKQLDLEGFIDYGFNLSKEEAAEIMKRFDRNGDGVIDYDEFLRFLRVRNRAYFNEL